MKTVMPADEGLISFDNYFSVNSADDFTFNEILMKKNFFAALTKFIPSLSQMTAGTPRQTMNLSNPITDEHVPMDKTTKICEALMVRKVSRKHPRFSEPLLIETLNTD